MKRAMTTFFCILILVYLDAQDSSITDTINLRSETYLADAAKFGSEGFIDFSSIGAWNTSAQLVRFWIGEPDVFRIPILLFAGATNLPFSIEEANSAAIYDLVNPVGGNLSLAFDFFSKPLFTSSTEMTSLHWNLFGAGKMIRGKSLAEETSQTDLGYFLEGGFTFRTAAWDRINKGIAFFSARYVFTSMDGNTMESMFRNRVRPQGVRLETGILIKKRINLRISYFEATQGRGLPTLDKPQWRFGVDYKL